jgi:membrane associated rhomboid family serine protease
MRNNYVSTFVLLGLNVIVFAWLAIQQNSLMMKGNADVLAILHAGANLNPFTLAGEPWRIITAMFLHIGVIHLLVNMLSLYSLGKMLEPVLGTTKFLLIYFFCGIAAGLCSLFFNLYTISAGASGALFGLYGYMLGTELMESYHDRQRLGTVLINFIIFVIISAYFTTLFAVDMAGHVGGGIAGIVLSLLHYRFKGLAESRSLVVGLVLISCSMLLLPKDQLHYYRIFQRVLYTEKLMNKIYRNSRDDQQLKDSLAFVVPKWDSIYTSLRHLGDVRQELTRDTATLGTYVRLRKQDAVYRMMLIERESYVYMDSLEIINTRMDSLQAFDFNLNFSLPEDVAENERDTMHATIPSLQTKRIFYDALWKEIDDPSASVYYRIGAVDSLNRWQGQVLDYYRNGNIQMKGKYLDNMKNGVFLYYSESGKYSSAGRYVKEEAVGKWEAYHWNGVLHSEVYYNEGAFTRSVWDSLGSAQVVNGNGKSVSWHSNGQVSEEGGYKDGRRAGDWFGYHMDGRPYYHEFYRDNRLIRGVSEDRDGKRYVYDQLSLYPFPVIGMPEFKKYLQKNMRKSDTLNLPTGMVKVIFNVGADGSIWDFTVIQSLSLAQDREAIRLISEGPAWRPGLLHGHVKLPSQGYVEVFF